MQWYWWALILILVLALAGAAFATWWFLFRTKSPPPKSFTTNRSNATGGRGDMNDTNQLDDDATESMNEGRGLCRVLAVGVLLAVAAVAVRGDLVLTPDVSAYATTGAVAAVQAEVDVVSNLVETTRGTYVDIATNVVYHVVVSNGHWLIREVE